MTPEEAVACFERLKDEDPKGDEVAAELNEVSIAYTSMIEPQMTDYMIKLLRQQRNIPQPTVYQPAAQQPTLPHPMLPHPTIPQPTIPPSTAQQSAVQQPGGVYRSCPVHGCNSLAENTRLDHLRDHLAEAHGYERAANEYTVAPHHLKRKTVAVLRLLFVRDIRKLAWNQARMRALEEAIWQREQSCVSCHGFRRDMPHSIAQANASKKQNLIDLLIKVRKDFNKEGKLYNQSGNADGTWDEVYENLVSTFQLDRNTVTAAETQAEQYFGHVRTAMGDDPTQAVPPARVLRTHELVLKQNASLPSK